MTFWMRTLTGGGGGDGGDRCHGRGGRDRSRVRDRSGGRIFFWKGVEVRPRAKIDLARGAPNGDGGDGGSRYSTVVEATSAQK